jgi:hypothetical protein
LPELSHETAYVAITNINKYGGQDLDFNFKELFSVTNLLHETEEKPKKKCNKGNLDADKEVLRAH